MESLTKTQVVLLSLLLSFVTSIATGIMTTSLLQSAPAGVTQTINRVVERTIEHVSDSTSGGTTKEVQVVSEDDKVTSSIAKNTPSLVRINLITNNGSPTFYSIGTVISKNGEIMAERTPEFSTQFPYTGTLSNGVTINLYVDKELSDLGIVLFKSDPSTTQTFTPISFTDALPVLGQTVIVLEGNNNTSALVGRIVSIEGNSSTTPKNIDTDLNDTTDTVGAPLFDLSGNMIGLRDSNDQTGRTFLYAPMIERALAH